MSYRALEKRAQGGKLPTSGPQPAFVPSPSLAATGAAGLAQIPGCAAGVVYAPLRRRSVVVARPARPRHSRNKDHSSRGQVGGQGAQPQGWWRSARSSGGTRNVPSRRASIMAEMTRMFGGLQGGRRGPDRPRRGERERARSLRGQGGHVLSVPQRRLRRPGHRRLFAKAHVRLPQRPA
jgi:hypothetical protein